MKYLDRFHPNCFYHVFNHAVGVENLFKSHGNFLFFLKRFYRYMLPVCGIYSYCLMPNHFHFLIRFRDEKTMMELAKINCDDEFDYHKFLMQKLSNFLNSYAKAYNKQQRRMGALFLDFTKRIEIKDNQDLIAIIKYIHHNPVRHGFCKTHLDWRYSSYREIISPKNMAYLEKELVLELFGGTTEFIEFHRD